MFQRYSTGRAFARGITLITIAILNVTGVNVIACVPWTFGMERGRARKLPTWRNKTINRESDLHLWYPGSLSELSWDLVGVAVAHVIRMRSKRSLHPATQASESTTVAVPTTMRQHHKSRRANNKIPVAHTHHASPFPYIAHIIVLLFLSPLLCLFHAEWSRLLFSSPFPLHLSPEIPSRF